MNSFFTFVIISDTAVAELIKEVTDTDDFRTCVIEQQGCLLTSLVRFIIQSSLF